MNRKDYKMKVTKYEFDGTPEEFRSVANLFGANSSMGESIQDEDLPTQIEDNVVQPKEAIRKMIKRRPVPQGQRDVYKALRNGEVKSEDMAEKIHRRASEYAGVMGALGRRINNTKEINSAGLPANVYAIINYRKSEDGTFLSLTPEAKEVLEEEGLI